MTLSLVYRAARPSLLAHPSTRVSLTTLSTRHASSAIHKGLARSERARPQGPRSARGDSSESATKMTYAERQKARQQLAAERPDFKIRKGKKDITEYPDQSKAKSRQARFYDPDSPHGKKSLVYQLKTGKLREELKVLESRDGGGSAFEQTGPRPDLRPSPRRSAIGSGGVVSTHSAAEAMQDLVAELSRPAGASRGAPRGDRDAARERSPRTERGSFNDRSTFSRERDAARRDTDRGGRYPPREDRDDMGASFRGRDALRRDTDRGSRDGPGRDRVFPPRERDSFSRDDTLVRTTPPKKDREPISIPYTTAASQFLYGTSVVEAALRLSRRKLYKLYIYEGPNRQNTSTASLIYKLAERKQVPVTAVRDETGLRLMNKMSSSRPHNGFVLEASPLPEPPLTALGPLPEDYTTNPIVPLVLAHQSAEEAAINGTSPSIPSLSSSATHKPLIIVLDRILDPGNLGAILRTVSFLGASGVCITSKASASLTPIALKASAGAAEAMNLFSVSNLPEFLNLSRANGWSVFAAVAEGPRGTKQRRHMDLWDVQEQDPLRREPCVLVLGNEGEGLDRLVVKKADYEVNIPNLGMAGLGVVDSLNVSVAAGLLCAAFMRGVGREMAGGREGERGESIF